MSTNFWELLQQHQNDLTKSGHMVADYLVQHAAEAQYLSISSLARECKVAEATVFRFCRALGFEGYHEMSLHWHRPMPPAHWSTSVRRSRMPTRPPCVSTPVRCS